MNLKDLSIADFMKIQLTIETFSDDENKMNLELVKLIHGTTAIEKRQADQTIQELIEIVQAQPQLIQRFVFDGIEYGFEPNLDNIMVGPFVDLEFYLKDRKQLDRIAAILYRPVIRSMGNMYAIEEYEGSDKYLEVMKKVNYKVVIGAMFFFVNLLKELLKETNTFIQEQMEKMNQKKIS